MRQKYSNFKEDFKNYRSETLILKDDYDKNDNASIKEEDEDYNEDLLDTNEYDEFKNELSDNVKIEDKISEDVV